MNYKITLKTILITTMVSLMPILFGCTDTPPHPSEPTSLAQESESDPNDFVVQSPVSPVSPIPTPVEVEIQEPDQGFGNVGGLLLTDNPQAEGALQPVSIIPVYLAPIITNDEGVPTFAGLDYNTDPTATTNQTGIFIIQNVPPGQYGLVVLVGVTPYLIKNEEGRDFVITVEAGKALDLGEIYADLPSL